MQIQCTMAFTSLLYNVFKILFDLGYYHKGGERKCMKYPSV